MGSRVELFEAIRRDHRRNGTSIHELSRRYGCHRKTVRQALESAIPPDREPRRWRSRKIDPAKPFIDAMLREDLNAPRKQQHTARRVLARLIDEHDLDGLTYSAVRDYVAVRRPEIAAESGRLVDQVYVPQTHELGGEAEVDFADLWIDLDGVRTKVALFTLRMSRSGKAVHRAYTTQGQEAFLEGHLAAWDVLGGTPTDKIRYDNLKSAVSRVLFGRNRVESERWVLFRSHYGFETFYCQPGVDGAHEKGGVEGEGGRFRRTHLVPVPKVATMAELNERLAAYDATDDGRRIANRTRTVGEDFALESPCLRPLPKERFEPGLALSPRVDRHARVMVRQCHYSVPARLINRRVRVVLRASEVLIYDGRALVATHERSARKGSAVLLLDHYLEVLARRPGALPGATALAQARQAGTFTAAHEAFWAAARKAQGDTEGTRQLIEVLLLHRHMRAADVVAGLEAAISVGAVNADVVAVEARRLAQQRPGLEQQADLPADEMPAGARVVSLTQRRMLDPAAVIAGLPPDTRPLPTVDRYDQLLQHPASST